MHTPKGVVLSASAGVGAPRLFQATGPVATVLLSYSFFAPGESQRHSIDRLRRQLEWLRRNYRPISVPQLLQELEKGAPPDGAVVVTTDDALLDVYKVSEEFKSFGVPLAVFVCVGMGSFGKRNGNRPPQRGSDGDPLVRARFLQNRSGQ